MLSKSNELRDFVKDHMTMLKVRTDSAWLCVRCGWGMCDRCMSVFEMFHAFGSAKVGARSSLTTESGQPITNRQCS